MSDGDWIKRNASRLGFLVALAIALSTIVWGWNYGLTQEFTYEQEARQAHANYTKNTCNKIAEAQAQSPSVKKADGEPCTPAEKAKQENDSRRNYADLVAQRSSALWAKIMGIAALIGMGLSFVGVALVWTTFRETRKANDIARDGHRAWVKLEAKGPRTMVIGHPKSTLHIGVELVNFGQSPATNIRCWGKIYFEPVSTEKVFSDVTRYYKSNITSNYSNVIFTNDKIVEQIDIECLDVNVGRYDIIAVVSCCYRVIGSDKLHFTARTFDISSQAPNAPPRGDRGQFQFHGAKSHQTMIQVLPSERKDVSAIAT